MDCEYHYKQGASASDAVRSKDAVPVCIPVFVAVHALLCLLWNLALVQEKSSAKKTKGGVDNCQLHSKNKCDFMLSIIFLLLSNVCAYDLVGTWANEDGESLVVDSVDDGRFYGEYASIIDSHLGMYNVSGIVEKDCELKTVCMILFSTIWQNEHKKLNSMSTWSGLVSSDGLLVRYVTFGTYGDMKLKDQRFTKQKLVNLFESFM